MPWKGSDFAYVTCPSHVSDFCSAYLSSWIKCPNLKVLRKRKKKKRLVRIPEERWTRKESGDEHIPPTFNMLFTALQLNVCFKPGIHMPSFLKTQLNLFCDKTYTAIHEVLLVWNCPETESLFKTLNISFTFWLMGKTLLRSSLAVLVLFLPEYFFFLFFSF